MKKTNIISLLWKWACDLFMDSNILDFFKKVGLVFTIPQPRTVYVKVLKKDSFF